MCHTRATKSWSQVWFLNIICICSHGAIDFLKLTFFRDKNVKRFWNVKSWKSLYEIIGSLRKFYLCKIMANMEMLSIICLHGNSLIRTHPRPCKDMLKRSWIFGQVQQCTLGPTLLQPHFSTWSTSVRSRM